MIKRNIMLGLLALTATWGCIDDARDPVVSLNTAPQLTTPSEGTSFDLVEDAAEAEVTTFEWTAADFGYQAAIQYSVEFDSKGNNFESAINLGSVNKELILEGLTVGRLNNILLAKGLPFGFANELEVRVCAEVSDIVGVLCSDAVTITVSPYQADVIYPKLTVPGDYQGWDPADETRAVYSRKSDEIYEGYIYFPIDNAVYKFAQNLSWDTNWGDNESDGILDLGGLDNNISIETAGMYFVRADLNTLEHTNMRTSWGVVGDATPGGTTTDTDFEWDADRGVLSVTLDLSVGELRFRANDTDEVNFGDNFNNGTLDTDGDNIPITEAGNYTIDLILNVSDYIYTITKN
ncbi:MAG: SusE domain-containing protein [Bacteroidota bacterium]